MFSTIYLCKTTIHCLIFIYFLLFHTSNTLCTDFFYWSDFSLQANNSRTCPPLRSNVDQMNGFRSRSRLQNNVGPLLPCVGFTQVGSKYIQTSQISVRNLLFVLYFFWKKYSRNSISSWILFSKRSWIFLINKGQFIFLRIIVTNNGDDGGSKSVSVFLLIPSEWLHHSFLWSK